MYGLTGYPLCHSFSEKYFSEKFERENIGECYRLFPLTDLQSLDVLLTKNADLRGLNVTYSKIGRAVHILTLSRLMRRE